MSPFSTDVLIIGSGITGLVSALQLADDCRVIILSKTELGQGSSYYAQGGIAGVIDPSDSFEDHINDTLGAGSHLNDEEAVKFVVENAQEAIQNLIDLGVPFTQDHFGNTPFHLTKEGGHSARRVIHVADHTGRSVQQTLIPLVKNHPNIQIIEDVTAVDLIQENNTCIGAYTIHRKTNEITAWQAKYTLLATGGASKAYMYTTNPDSSTGDGIAMAWRAGCRVANMEFTQFHPTCLYHPKAKSFLITEAVRGEGGKLSLPDGSAFMHKYDEREELAPRDIVARSIDHEMKRSGADYVNLDISHKPAEFIMEHFPMIYQKCLSLGIDITKDPIPVVPASHYTCGGVMTDLNGETDLDRLYAIGEVAYTGLHGANRLASNSLLECLVFAHAAKKHILSRLQTCTLNTDVPSWDGSHVRPAQEYIMIYHDWDEVRRLMWDYVGIVRRDLRLERARKRIQLILDEIQEFYQTNVITSDFIELRNLVQVSDLIIRSASARKHSIGLHYNIDHPESVESPQPTILSPEESK